MEASRAGQKLRLLRPPADRAFEQLYQRHAREVYQYALALLTNPADAEDVTQTTFMNAYRAFKRGERPHKPHNWLIAITHNVCRMRWRQAGARPREVALDEAPEPAANDHERPNLDEVLTALANLSFNQRAALVMRELEGRSYQEISEVLGLSVSAVEALLFRARRRLRIDRAGLGVLTTVPLPGSLSSLLGAGGGGAVAAGGSAVGAGLVLKAATVVAVGAVTAGVGYKSVGHGFFLEDGIEHGNEFVRNLAIQIKCHPTKTCVPTNLAPNGEISENRQTIRQASMSGKDTLLPSDNTVAGCAISVAARPSGREDWGARRPRPGR